MFITVSSLIIRQTLILKKTIVCPLKGTKSSFPAYKNNIIKFAWDEGSACCINNIISDIVLHNQYWLILNTNVLCAYLFQIILIDSPLWSVFYNKILYCIDVGNNVIYYYGGYMVGGQCNIFCHWFFNTTKTRIFGRNLDVFIINLFVETQVVEVETNKINIVAPWRVEH